VTTDLRLRELLFKYFLSPFIGIEYYSFTFSNGDVQLNPLFQFATDVFDGDEAFQEKSVDIANYLYDVSLHPQIKSGDLFVAYFSDVRIDDELVDAIGIFKSENRQPFLKLDESNEGFSLGYEEGINVEKLDKGCLIVNTHKDMGYRICVVDGTNVSNEAQFWKDSFLNVTPFNDEFYQTSQFLRIAKLYATEQLTADCDATKADQIDFLSRSVGYFKQHDQFDRQDFETEIFRETDAIDSFQRFDLKYRIENGVNLVDKFGISQQAVKKQARFFKSVLKLDKNFHIYIHGGRDMIERGAEPDGRKYYKIYFNRES
jgi:hypothetical protein